MENWNPPVLSIEDESYLACSMADSSIRRLEAAVGALRYVHPDYRPDPTVLAQVQERLDFAKEDLRQRAHRHKWLTGGRKWDS